MSDIDWSRWLIHTARNWEDIAPIVQITCIEDIDHDHHLLYGYALELNNLIYRIENESYNLDSYFQIGELCARMHQQMKSHFEREEDLLRRSMLPEFQRHGEHHQHILQELKKIITAISQGRHTLTTEVKYRILGWIFDHNNDMDISTFRLDNWLYCIQHATSLEQVEAAIPSTFIPSLDQARESATRMLIGLGATGTDLLARATAQLRACFALEEKCLAKMAPQYIHEHNKAHGDLLEKISLHAAGGNHEELAQFRFEILLAWIEHMRELDHAHLSTHTVGVHKMHRGRPDINEALQPGGAHDEQHAARIMQSLCAMELHFKGGLLLNHHDSHETKSLADGLRESFHTYCRTLVGSGRLPNVEPQLGRLVTHLDNYQLLLDSGVYPLAAYTRDKIYALWLGILYEEHLHTHQDAVIVATTPQKTPKKRAKR